MVIDELEAKEKAEYSFRCIWQTLGQIDLSEQTLKVDQKGKTFYIKSADGARFKLSEDTDQGGKLERL